MSVFSLAIARGKIYLRPKRCGNPRRVGAVKYGARGGLLLVMAALYLAVESVHSTRMGNALSGVQFTVAISVCGKRSPILGTELTEQFLFQAEGDSFLNGVFSGLQAWHRRRPNRRRQISFKREVPAVKALTSGDFSPSDTISFEMIRCWEGCRVSVEVMLLAGNLTLKKSCRVIFGRLRCHA